VEILLQKGRFNCIALSEILLPGSNENSTSPVRFCCCSLLYFLFINVLFLSSGAAGRVFYFAGSDKYAFANNWNRELWLSFWHRRRSKREKERALPLFVSALLCCIYYLILRRASGTASSNFICSPACNLVLRASEAANCTHTLAKQHLSPL
jgi:hypothetical protein